MTARPPIMFSVLSTLKLLLAIVLALLGVCGNLVIPFVSYRTTLRCPLITVLAALDFVATLLGPGLMLVSVVKGPHWSEHNKTLCRSLSFLSSLVLITSFLVLFFLAVSCQKVQFKIPLFGKHRGKKGGNNFLAMCLLTGLLSGVQTFLGWRASIDLNLVPYCIFFTNAKVVSKNYISYLACSLMVLSFLTIFLAVRAMKQRQLYPVQQFWERHKYEEKLNDPEMTTVASVSSSYQSYGTVTSNKSYWSRRSSGRSRGSTVLSVVASPLVSRKNSQQSRLNMQESVLLDILRLTHQNVLRIAASTNGTNENGGKESSEMVYLDSAVDCERTPSPRTSGSWSSSPDPFVITSHQLPILPFGKNVFRSPCFLPQFKALRRQRSLSRLLLLKSCVTGLCWLPLYAAVALVLFSVQYPQELHVFVQWLIFLPSCTSPLFPLCDAGYKRALRRAACSRLETRARRYQTETAQSRDVEFKIEGTQQVRLMALRFLDIETLQENVSGHKDQTCPPEANKFTFLEKN